MISATDPTTFSRTVCFYSMVRWFLDRSCLHGDILRNREISPIVCLVSIYPKPYPRYSTYKQKHIPQKMGITLSGEGWYILIRHKTQPQTDREKTLALRPHIWVALEHNRRPSQLAVVATWRGSGQLPTHLDSDAQWQIPNETLPESHGRHRKLIV